MGATSALSRRTVIASLAASAVTGAPAPGRPPATLSSAAARSGRWFGSAVRSEHLAAGHPLRPLLLRECSSFTPEIALKWDALEARQGVLDFTAMDELAGIALDSGVRLHGHTLLWHRSLPAWAGVALGRRDGWGLVDRYFASVMPRYGAAIRSWDVVNEPCDAGGRADGLRETPLLAAFGPGYVERALRLARQYAPRAALAINEYGLDLDIAEDEERRAALLRLVSDLRGRDVPLDVVGIQAHLDLGRGPFSESVFDRFLRDLAATGVAIEITELDVKEFDYIASQDERDRQVAALVLRYLSVALRHRAVRGVTTWGISDAASWLEVTDADRARYPGAWQDGPGPGLNRGLPFDAAMRPKPIHAAILRAFDTAGVRAGR